MKSTFALIGLTALLAISCGRAEPLDKAFFEVFLDNPFDSDVTPLSAYHGQFKAQIVEAKNLAEEMGVKFSPIFIRHGQGDDQQGGFCADGGPLGRRIVLYPDSWPDLGKTPYYLVSLLLHEHGHCGRHLTHDNHGIMKAEGQDYSVEAQLGYMVDFNNEHQAGLDLGPYLRFAKEKDPALVTDTALVLRLAAHIKNLKVKTDLTVERFVQNPARIDQIVYGSDICAKVGMPSLSSTCPKDNVVLKDFLADGFLEVECQSRELVYDEAHYEVGETLDLNIRATAICPK